MCEIPLNFSGYLAGRDFSETVIALPFTTSLAQADPIKSTICQKNWIPLASNLHAEFVTSTYNQMKQYSKENP